MVDDPLTPHPESGFSAEARAFFLEEAPEHLGDLQARIENLPATIADNDQLQEIYRSTFALRGELMMLGYASPIVNSSGLDDCLQQLAQHPTAADITVISMLLNLLTILQKSIQFIAQGVPLTDARWTNLSQ